jgi:hypothetical protein
VSRDPFRHEPVFAMRSAEPVCHSAPDCFKDEVAIDFPALGDVVERVRDAFLGDDAGHDGPTFRQVVRLSNGEARRGTIVPLDLPLKGFCRCCGGRGEVWNEPCLDCCGSGDSLVTHPIRVSVPAGVSHGARFRFRVTAPHDVSVRVELRVAICT